MFMGPRCCTSDREPSRGHAAMGFHWIGPWVPFQDGEPGSVTTESLCHVSLLGKVPGFFASIHHPICSPFLPNKR